MKNHHGRRGTRNMISRTGFRAMGIAAIAISVFAFMAMSFSVMSQPSVAIAAACGTTGDISGVVFYDYNNNGVQDANEPGIEGVTVSGYLSGTSGTDSAGTACETGSDGSYTFNQSQFPVRIEFSLPTSLEAYLKPSAAGGTTVQFVNAASNAVNVGYHDPADYCQNTFDFSTTCFVYGIPSNITTPQDAIVTLDFDEPGLVETATAYDNDFRFPAAPHDIEAETNEVGSVLGLAYAGGSDHLFASAWVKRHVELGPEGAGAIYRTDVTANTTQLYFDINSLPGAPAGEVTNRPDAAPTSGWPGGTGPNKHLFFDVDAYLKTGTTGLGDIDLSPDDKTLFVVNMGDKKMYTLPADSATLPVPAADVNSVDIPNTCSNPDDARPMALGYNNGKMYVGSVCSGQSIVDLIVTQSPTMTNDITFTYSADFDTLFGDTFFAEVFEYDLATNTFDTDPVIKVDLTYQRGCIYREDLETFPGSDIPSVSNPALQCENQSLNWRPWQSDWEQVFNADLASGNVDNPTSGYPLEYPQPLLSDIEFDGEDMILGLRDLNGDRTGFASGAPSTSQAAPGFPPEQNWRGAGFGDILRACFDGTDFVLENNGVCGSSTTIGQGNPQGPGGGEYYWNDTTPGGPNATSAEYFPIDASAGHEESSMGMLMQVSALDNVVVPVVDVSEFYDGGFIWFNNDTGASEKRVKLYDSVVEFEPPRADLEATGSGLAAGKANGIGDIEALCLAAPIEIGNLVWIDDNANGIQDPGESGAAGVTVVLYAESDLTTPIGTATTDANGTYYFSSGPGTDTASSIYNLNILPETAYRIVIEQNQAGTDIEGFFPTLSDTPSATNSDIRDSDAVSVTRGTTQFVDISLTTGVIGENDHTFDAGFASEPISPIYRDWGDLPDTFNTTSNVDGPRHILVDNLRMGECVDGEIDGSPSAQALGDDENQSASTPGGSGVCNPAADDEDGIGFRTFVENNTALAVCTSIDIFVQAYAVPALGEEGYLNAWADLNADGQFTPDEQFVTDNTVNASLVENATPLRFPIQSLTEPAQVTQAVLGLNIPCEQSLVGQNMGFRFRYTAGTGIGGDSPTGEAANGEVEDYILPIYGWDFGDSPECTDSADSSCYQTSVPASLIGDYKDTNDSSTLGGGARHIVIPGSVRLGTSVATEINAEVAADGPTSNTGGDGSAEEDGWAYNNEASLLISRWDNGQDGFIRVNVTQVDPVLGACVYGFIDWEGNGFESGFDSVGVQYVSTDGEATINFPATLERDEFFNGIGSVPRGVHVRFRVVEGDGVAANCEAKDQATDSFAFLPGNANGYACSGEVEDYYVNFTPLAVTMQDFEATQDNTNSIIFIIVLSSLLMATAFSLLGYRRRMAEL